MRNEMLKILESTKHYLWHGNVGHARNKIEDMLGRLDELEEEGTGGENVPKLQKALEELESYLTANEPLIPNYGERWRNEEAIATGFVESAVNQIVNKRFAKRNKCNGLKKAPICCCKHAHRCSMAAWKRRSENGIPDFGLKVNNRPPEHPLFYALPSSKALRLDSRELSLRLKSNRAHSVKESANGITRELKDSERRAVDLIGLKCESCWDSVNQRKGKVGYVC
jgi:hypothetical protein